MSTLQKNSAYTKYIELAFHLAAALLLSYFFLEMWDHDWEGPRYPGRTIFSAFFLSGVITFYLNTYWLIPKFLGTKKWVLYILVLIAYVVLLEIIRSTVLAIIIPGPGFVSNFKSLFWGIINSTGAAVFGLVLSFAYRFTRDWIININVITRLHSEKTEMELAFLKSQVDPHFLFNTLNNLYALALEENGTKTADGIAKLGTLMRYNLHDSSAEAISLEKEIDYIQKYIDLQLLRVSSNNQVEFHKEIPEAEARVEKIAPMLLIIFVENAFKYGISPSESGKIIIQLKLEQQQLSMQVVNNIVNKSVSQEPGGLGLQNVRNRLELLYPKKHELVTSEEAGTFQVNLSINLRP
ncbi:MAG: histidine kinase [Saprospiraceae bacterium]|nr:histidine kinase [Saprospiraceae bacterium]